MVVRLFATCAALLGLPWMASGTGLASSSVDQILRSEQVPIVSLPLPEFDKPVVSIAGPRPEPFATELSGITEFPLLDCPRCDETVFLDRTSPLSYIRRLAEAQANFGLVESIPFPRGAPDDDPNPTARFAYAIRFHPKLIAFEAPPEATGPTARTSAHLDNQVTAYEAHLTSAFQLTMILLFGGGLIGVCCLVLAAERTRYHPRNSRPRPTFDVEPPLHVLPGGVRPPWRCFLTLGVSPSSSPEEIKHAYREKALAAHPDRGGDVEEFLELTSAFEEALAYATTYQLMMAESRRRETASSNGHSSSLDGADS